MHHFHFFLISRVSCKSEKVHACGISLQKPEMLDDFGFRFDLDGQPSFNEQ